MVTLKIFILMVLVFYNTMFLMIKVERVWTLFFNSLELFGQILSQVRVQLRVLKSESEECHSEETLLTANLLQWRKDLFSLKHAAAPLSFNSHDILLVEKSAYMYLYIKPQSLTCHWKTKMDYFWQFIFRYNSLPIIF